jgi:Fe-S-cluster containining protein
MIHPLSHPYATRWKAPVVDRVDTAIFVRRYFTRCMDCTFCHDSCCQYGADIDGTNVARLDAVADDLERYTGVARDRRFTGEWNEDVEFPGGRQTRTRVADGACVFRSRTARGCAIHSFATSRGVDYHELKPLVCVLFPVTFDYGLLHCSNEIEDKSLQCYGEGPTIYEGVRGEIEWYFGAELVTELDGVLRAIGRDGG